MNKKYTAEELDLLHTELYDILGETIRVCQKHDIPYFVIGGTAIGAIGRAYQEHAVLHYFLCQREVSETLLIRC